MSFAKSNPTVASIPFLIPLYMFGKSWSITSSTIISERKQVEHICTKPSFQLFYLCGALSSSHGCIDSRIDVQRSTSVSPYYTIRRGLFMASDFVGGSTIIRVLLVS